MPDNTLIKLSLAASYLQIAKARTTENKDEIAIKAV